MRIPTQTTSQILWLIDEGLSLHPSDLEAFHQWIHATYGTLQFDSVQQQRFDEYCRSACDMSRAMRLRCGVSMLRQLLHKADPENYAQMGEQM
jgi:hypothetical protein